MDRLANPVGPHLIGVAHLLTGEHNCNTRFVDQLVTPVFPYYEVFSRISNFLYAEAARRAVLCKQGLFRPFQAAWWGLKVAAIFHLKSVASAELSSLALRQLQFVSTREKAS